MGVVRVARLDFFPCLTLLINRETRDFIWEIKMSLANLDNLANSGYGQPRTNVIVDVVEDRLSLLRGVAGVAGLRTTENTFFTPVDAQGPLYRLAGRGFCVQPTSAYFSQLQPLLATPPNLFTK